MVLLIRIIASLYLGRVRIYCLIKPIPGLCFVDCEGFSFSIFHFLLPEDHLRRVGDHFHRKQKIYEETYSVSDSMKTSRPLTMNGNRPRSAFVPNDNRKLESDSANSVCTSR